MNKYLGERVLKVEESDYKDYTPQMWALFWRQCCGGIDGVHHKAWLLDQIVRILHGTKVILKLATFECEGLTETEVRFSLDEPTTAYWSWVRKFKNLYDEYDFGIAP